jgi:hypothetical protein
VPVISGADAATISASDITHALQNPTPTTTFKQPGMDRMQVIKKLAVIFEENAPHGAATPRVNTTAQHTNPAPRLPTRVN